MNKFIIKYSKTGYLKYISHLDLMRLFHRSFKRGSIKLRYSNGYNPHPKMVIAQPLSLGYESTGDYLEIETCNEMEPNSIMEILNNILPKGIEILKCKSLDGFNKTLASLVEYASYEIELMTSKSVGNEALVNFIESEQINVEKYQHKNNSTKIIDIKPMIKEFKYEIFTGLIKINVILCAGSARNLNPELFILGLLKFCGISEDDVYIKINRNDIYFKKDNEIISMENIG
ncbi:MAG: TIGR03936 family radical SAM-associated protein [Eubacteriales bacterium]